MNLLLLAERFNLQGVRWPTAERYISEGRIEGWLSFSLRCSCFQRRCGPSIKKLEMLGVKMVNVRCMNLLPPGDVGEWDSEEASRVGLAWLEWIMEQEYSFTHIAVLGVRAARAVLGYRAGLLSEHSIHGDNDDIVKVIVLPHPSGQNRWWNDSMNIESAQELVEEWRAA